MDDETKRLEAAVDTMHDVTKVLATPENLLWIEAMGMLLEAERGTATSKLAALAVHADYSTMAMTIVKFETPRQVALLADKETELRAVVIALRRSADRIEDTLGKVLT